MGFIFGENLNCGNTNIGVKGNAGRYMFCVARARDLHGVESGNPGPDSVTLSLKLIYAIFAEKCILRTSQWNPMKTAKNVK